MLKYLNKSKLLPRLYSDYNTRQVSTYYDYENYTLHLGNLDDYEVFCKVGQGKYSEVFKGNDIIKNQKVILKVLKPNQMKKIQREVLVLKSLPKHQNIIELTDVVQDIGSQRYTLVFPEQQHINLKQNYDKLTLQRIQFIIKNILLALDHTHQYGVFHRDIKPQNILTDFTYLKVIDWGLAEFYHPNKEYNVRVASRYFKAPELLLDIRNYHHSLDIWSTGCVMAGMIFKREPFFRGVSNDDQLLKIIQVLGTNTLKSFLSTHSLKLPIRYSDLYSKFYNKKNLDFFINEENQQFCTPEALDLLDKMLTFDFTERILPSEALKHPFFNDQNNSN